MLCRVKFCFIFASCLSHYNIDNAIVYNLLSMIVLRRLLATNSPQRKHEVQFLLWLVTTFLFHPGSETPHFHRSEPGRNHCWFLVDSSWFLYMSFMIPSKILYSGSVRFLMSLTWYQRFLWFHATSSHWYWVPIKVSIGCWNAIALLYELLKGSCSAFSKLL